MTGEAQTAVVEPAPGTDTGGDAPNDTNEPVEPIARVRGEPVTQLPKDLYIPPEALEVFLDAFEGPLDLLLYLIKRQNLDILDIPIAEITRQYIEYVELMKELQLELAAEYLVMAAMLAEIKSRMLLPRPVEEGQEADPRAELIRRLQEYERFKKAAEDLDALHIMGRDVFQATASPPELHRRAPHPQVELVEILNAFRAVLERAEMYSHHHIRREALSVRERMSGVLRRVEVGGFVEFASLFTPQEGRHGVVVTLLAILELVKERMIELVQAEPYTPIHVKAPNASGEVLQGEDATVG